MAVGRSKFMLVLLAVAVAAYLPACCCWTQTMAGWFVSIDENPAHCCDSEQENEPATPEDRPCDHDHDGACGCVKVERARLDGPGQTWLLVAQVMWLDLPSSFGARRILQVSVITRTWEGPDGRSGTLLRQHGARIG